MRVSTSQIYEQGSQSIGRQQAEWLRTQQQLSSGRRVLAPSDDPTAAAQALRLEQASARASQHAANQSAARDGLALAEAALGQAGEVLQDARALLVQANGGVLSDRDRGSLAIELRNHFASLLGIANSRDANGEFVFSGFQGGTAAFAETASGASYQGDQGERSLEVAEGRSLGVSVNGAEVFDRVPTGNGNFEVRADPANSGTGLHDGGAVADAALLTGHDYRVQFSVAGATTTYDVLDLTAGTTVIAAAPWSSGQAITFDGQQLTVQGSPAAGDRFDTAPSAARSVFESLRSLINLLETPVQGGAGRAALGNGLVNGMQAIDQAAEGLLTARARAGAGLAELEGLDAMVSAGKLENQRQIAALTELDYAEAASRFAAQQTALDAAQRSYARVTSLSLFQYL